MIACSKCGKKKPDELFARGRLKADGTRITSECKDCLNARARARYSPEKEKAKRKASCRFKLSLKNSRKSAKKFGHEPCVATESEISSSFTGKCEICGVPESECDQSLHMDHCHETGRFRGWLCRDCNNMLGRAKDSPAVLRTAALYLEDL